MARLLGSVISGIILIEVLALFLIHEAGDGAKFAHAVYCECDSIRDESNSCLYGDYYPASTYNCKVRSCGTSYVCSPGAPKVCKISKRLGVPVFQVTAIPPYPSSRRACSISPRDLTVLTPINYAMVDYYLPSGSIIAKTCAMVCYESLGYECDQQAMVTMKANSIPLDVPFTSPFDFRGKPPSVLRFQCSFPYIAPLSPRGGTEVSATSYQCATKAVVRSLEPVNVAYTTYKSTENINVCEATTMEGATNFCACRRFPDVRRRSIFSADTSKVSAVVKALYPESQYNTYEFALGHLLADKVRVSSMNSSAGAQDSNRRDLLSSDQSIRYSGFCESVSSPNRKYAQICCELHGQEKPWVCLPSMILIGAQKSGTTALFAHLLEHPEFRSAESMHYQGTAAMKEAHFFDTDYAWNSGLGHYLGQFRAIAQHQRSAFLNSDMSPSYMVKWSTLQSLRELIPHARLVIMLRDPVQRAWSELKMKIRQDASANEWKGLLSRHATEIKSCIEQINNYTSWVSIKQNLDRCISKDISIHDRWSRFFNGKIHRAIRTAGLADDGNGRSVPNVQQVVRQLFDTSENGTTVIVGMEHAVQQGYSSEFLDANVIYEKISIEIAEIERCLEEGDFNLKRCFTNKAWISSDISRGHVLRGMYFAQISNVYELFPKDQVLVIEMEELRSDPITTIKRVCRHVGLNDFRFQIADSATLSRRIDTYMPGFSDLSGWRLQHSSAEDDNKIPARLRSLLSNFYASHNEKLFALLGKQYDWSS